MRIDAATRETLSEHPKGRDDRLAQVARMVSRARAQAVRTGEERPPSDPCVEVEGVRPCAAWLRKAPRHGHVPRAGFPAGPAVANDAAAVAPHTAEHAVNPERDRRRLGEPEVDLPALGPVEEARQDAQETQHRLDLVECRER